jgi:hypothetical protein
MARARLRSRREVTERCRGLSGLVASALARTGAGELDPAAVDELWQGEGLGMLLWACLLAELPPYDRPFDHAALVRAELGEARLRPVDEVAAALETARLWLWRARTTGLQTDDEVELPAPWESFDQLVAATAMRGHERGLLPRPLRGDFPAFGTVYRSLDEDQQAEAFAIAWERYRALEWLLGLGRSWDDIPTDA